MKLKPFPRFVLILAIAAGVFFGGKAIWNSVKDTKVGQKFSETVVPKEKTAPTSEVAKETKAAQKAGTPKFRFGAVRYGGMAPVIVRNGGEFASTQSKFYTQEGILVEIVIDDDPARLIDMWKSGNLDGVCLTTDAMPFIVNYYREKSPQIICMTDKSYGGDMIWGNESVNSTDDVTRSTRIAYCENSPSVTFAQAWLEAGGKSLDDVEKLPMASPGLVTRAYQIGDADVAVVWGDWIAQVDDQAVPGSHPLASTLEFSDLLQGIMFTSKEYANSNRDVLVKFLTGWFREVAYINTPAGRQHAIEILTSAYKLPDAQIAVLMLDGCRLMSLGDNREFFGIDRNPGAFTGQDMYAKYGAIYERMGLTGGQIPLWSEIADPTIVRDVHLSGPEYAAEGSQKFASSPEDVTTPAISTKRVTVNFGVNSAELSADQKVKIRREFGDIYKQTRLTKVRIEGNTDSDGDTEYNRKLSLRRAEAVMEELINSYGGDRSRFIIVGNGEDKPITTNNTDAGKAANRRTEFQLLPAPMPGN